MTEAIEFLPCQLEKIDAYLKVARSIAIGIGPGRVERVYHRAFEIYLTNLRSTFESEEQFTIKFHCPISRLDYIVANERLDLRTIDDDAPFIFELKAISKVDDACFIQLIHYMEHFSYTFGAVVNFGIKSWQFTVVYRAPNGTYHLYDPQTRAVTDAPRHKYI